MQADKWLLGKIALGTQLSLRRCFQEHSKKILKARNSFYGGLIEGFAF